MRIGCAGAFFFRAALRCTWRLRTSPIRDWYPAPLRLNHRRTSPSSR